MVRWQSFWTAALPCKKGGFNFKDIKLPYDKEDVPKKIGKSKLLSRKELNERYLKSGFQLSESKLDSILK